MMIVLCLVGVGEGVDVFGGLALADCHVFEVIRLDVKRAVFEHNFDTGGLLDEIVALDCAFAVCRADFASDFRHLLVHLAVIGVFIFQATHESAAHATDFLRVEREPLDLCHLYGHLFKVRQVSGAAARSSARSESTAHLCVVALVYLTKFDADFEDGCERAHEFSEIDSAVCGEIEYEFLAVEGVFGVDKLHVQPCVCDLFARDTECFHLVFKVFLHLLHIFRRCFSHDRLQWLNDFGLVNLLVRD